MHRDILEAIGSPLVRVSSPAGTTVAAKLESFNPGGSAKDRPVRSMIDAAERDGRLEPGDRIVEPTSGNTGIGIALVGAVRGYEVTLVMPASQSVERRRLMAAYGADIDLVEGGMESAIDRADELVQDDGAVQLSQFDNPANPEAHYRTTAEEILRELDGSRLDAFVAAVGTGGTLTGTGRRLREAFPELLVVAVEPAESPVLSGGEPADHGFQGMGPGFVSRNTDLALIDRVEPVALGAAEAACRRLAREEGLLVGQSSGAAMLASTRVAEDLHEQRDDPLVVTVFPDSGERYLSTGLFDG